VTPLLKKSLPWALTLGAAALYAWGVANGGFGYRRETRPMPDLQAFGLDDGQGISGSSLRGQPAILNVWAPSCAPCRQELPSLDKLAADYAGRVRFLGLVAWGSPEEAQAVARSDGLSHLSLLSGGQGFLEALEVESVPTTFFIRSDGTIVARQVGLRGERFFRQQADELLAGQL
jgi:cytochrome c biogenesis protein CcmG, thiol:disulfide interchange protein DsbE